jgi:hypothetical protein
MGVAIGCLFPILAVVQLVRLWTHHDTTSRVVWWTLLAILVVALYYDTLVKAYQNAPELKASERSGCAGILMIFGIVFMLFGFALSIFAFWL